MTDEELATALRVAVSDVTMDVPEPSIRRRARQLRSRRRARRAAGAAALVAGAVAAPLALSGSSAPAQLDAWTIHKSGGTVQVDIRQLDDPARLQHDLRADGVPIIVVVPPSPPVTSSCRLYPEDKVNTFKVVQMLPAAGHPATDSLQRLVIRLSLLPADAIIWISVDMPGHTLIGFGAAVLQASPQCHG